MRVLLPSEIGHGVALQLADSNEDVGATNKLQVCKSHEGILMHLSTMTSGRKLLFLLLATIIWKTPDRIFLGLLTIIESNFSTRAYVLGIANHNDLPKISRHHQTGIACSPSKKRGAAPMFPVQGFTNTNTNTDLPV